MTLSPRLDKTKIKQSFSAAAGSYDAAAALQRQAGNALLAKFPPQPAGGVILDLGCGTGYLSGQLAALTEPSLLLALDIAQPMLTACRQKNPRLAGRLVGADAEKLPFARQSIRQIYSNLALQWCQDLAAVFSDCRRVLQTGGQLVFATFGPATLWELKAAWASVDSFTHVNQFYSLTQINNFLRQAGFESISAETAGYQSRYASVPTLMRELKALGAHNVNLHRNRQPTTRRQLQQMINYYQNSFSAGTKVVASYEIIFIRAER